MLIPKHLHLCAIVLAISAVVSTQSVVANVLDAPPLPIKKRLLYLHQRSLIPIS